MSKLIDLTGQTFNRLTVIRRATNEEKNNSDRQAHWLCQCECGNQTIVSSSNLRTGHTKSCGCLMREVASEIGKKTGHDNGIKNVKDLTGKRFGKLVVLSRAGSIKTKYGSLATWNCQCDCGNQKVIRGDCLRDGNTQSCGCTQSRGEERISQLLAQAGIPFEKEYAVIINERKLRFDFFVNGKYFIEYDGIQHYRPDKQFGSQNPEEVWVDLYERDIMKDDWCKDNNIPLIRIPYTKLDTLTIDDLLLKAE